MLLALQYLNYALVVFCLPDSRNKSQDCLFVLCCYNEDSGGVNMKDKKYYINLTEQERSQIIHYSVGHYEVLGYGIPQY